LKDRSVQIAVIETILELLSTLAFPSPLIARGIALVANAIKAWLQKWQAAAIENTNK
jgi:hypothetical protein